MSHDANACIKKEGSLLFDVMMESYYGVEICELAGLYILSKLVSLVGTKIFGLYRDDGQANGRKMNRIKKDIMALLKSKGLSIPIDTNLIEADFVNLSFKLDGYVFF